MTAVILREAKCIGSLDHCRHEPHGHRVQVVEHQHLPEITTPTVHEDEGVTGKGPEGRSPELGQFGGPLVPDGILPAARTFRVTAYKDNGGLLKAAVACGVFGASKMQATHRVVVVVDGVKGAAKGGGRLADADKARARYTENLLP